MPYIKLSAAFSLQPSSIALTTKDKQTAEPADIQDQTITIKLGIGSQKNKNYGVYI